MSAPTTPPDGEAGFPSAAGNDCGDATPGTTPEADLRGHQDWFLLYALARAKGHKLSKGQVNQRVRTKRVKMSLRLDPAGAARRLEELAAEGFAEAFKEGRAVSFRITEAGRSRLAGLTPHPAFLAKGQAVPEVPEALKKYQEAFLLLQLLEGEQSTLKKTDANKMLTGDAARDLELSPAVANFRRQQLIQRGYLEAGKDGRSETYRLTADGRDYLASQEQYPETAFRLKGKAVNHLLAAVREAERRLRDHAPGVARPLPADLKEAVLEEFRELLREKHGFTGLVPIHEIRQRLRDKYGEEAGRHDVLDELIRQLRREGRVNILPISDLQRATTEQLNGSIRGIDETLFYLEAGHAQPARG